MLLFGGRFALYFIKLSAGKGFFKIVHWLDFSVNI